MCQANDGRLRDIADDANDVITVTRPPNRPPLQRDIGGPFREHHRPREPVLLLPIHCLHSDRHVT